MDRASYHTSLKELVHHNLIPKQFVNKIPKSNLYRWKNDNFSRYVGSEVNQIADKHMELIQTLNEYPKMFQAYFHAWVIDTKFRCDGSFFKQCLKTYPTQITPFEIKQIKKALTNPTTIHWSMKSIYLNGIRKGQLSVSLKTLYKMNRLLEIRKTRGKIRRKKRKKKGIRATIPNRIWHTDITVMKTLDSKKYYIYLLIDNYSRKILSYDIKERVMGRITTKLIQDAYQKASDISKDLNVNLIVDGGSENNNIHVNNFINQSQINITKLVALKDLDFSNSMIERVNMTLKYRYLFPREIRDLKHLKRIQKKLAINSDKY